MPKKLTQEEFIKQMRSIHKNIDFSKSEYVNDSTKVECKCNVCGNIWYSTPNNLKGSLNRKPKGCPKCAHRSTKYTLDEWLSKAHDVWGDTYDLSLVKEYNNRTQKMPIICRKHGLKYITSKHFLSGHGCNECGREKMISKGTKPFEKMVEDARKIHGDKYTYHKETYTNVKTEMVITCPIHGDFLQTPHKHINSKHGCPDCGGSKPLTTDEVKKIVLENFGDKYDVSKLVYKNAKSKFILICPKHGEFKTNLWKIKQKTYRGCPKCQQTILEKEIETLLKEKNLKYIYQANKHNSFKWLNRQSLDFYLPDYKIAIECQGEQHYEPIKRFGGNDKFVKTVERDRRKAKLCEENGLKLLYFTHYPNIIEEGNIYKDKDKLLETINGYIKSK